tara:strand:- start:208 stop:915 length:708 start_codon:yes stop_codon:yes gene_type:complete
MDFDASCRVMHPVRHQIFVISPQKSGTTAIGEALRQLGYHTAQWQPELGDLAAANITEANRLIEAAPTAAHPATLRALLPTLVTNAHKFDAFSDYPMGHTFLDLRVKALLWPDARFIWCDRDPTLIAESQWHWNTPSHRDSTPPTAAWLETEVSRILRLRNIAQAVARAEASWRVLFLSNFSSEHLTRFLTNRADCVAHRRGTLRDIVPQGLHMHTKGQGIRGSGQCGLRRSDKC